MVTTKRRQRNWLVCTIVLFALFVGELAPPAFAQPFSDLQDPMDPFDRRPSVHIDGDNDADKSAQELISEALVLQSDDRLLDARTKLLRALQKDPKEYTAHLLLADYYLRHVGHFRLALKYVKRAMALFKEKHGSPPYRDRMARAMHMDLLNVYSNVRLNLDDYQGALDVLNQYADHGYFESWYPSSKAWVLMKLGKLEEAIKVAREGMYVDASPGHTLNVLGILLSMTGEREKSLSVFRAAIQYEQSLGSAGRPATPLNNSGEVYKEIFLEDKAIESWQKAMSLPDGCDHVLPSLNLALLLMEQANYEEAKRAIDSFETNCAAQFPLKNGEEHKALVDMARGRIDLHTGFVDEAIERLEAALERQQWFGKIGTSQEDLQVAVMISLAQALRAKNNQLAFRQYSGWTSWVGSLLSRSANRSRASWLLRRARQIMTEQLDQLEDIYIRHTDSMIEYPTFGTALAGFPTKALRSRVDLEERTDRRSPARLYYDAYIAENLLAHGSRSKGLSLLKEVLSAARYKYDQALRIHTMLLNLEYLKVGSEAYRKLAYEILQTVGPELRNAGFRLPVNLGEMPRSVRSALLDGPFHEDNSLVLPYRINYEHKDGIHILHFISNQAPVGNSTVKVDDLDEAVNRLSDSVFTKKLDGS